jgi:hypothetical protein
MLNQKLAVSGCLLASAIQLSTIASGAQQVLDDFNDNETDTDIWEVVFSDGHGAIEETNGRIEYTSPGGSIPEQGDDNGAYYRLAHYLDLNDSWSVTMDVHVSFQNTMLDPGHYEYGMEIGLRNPNHPDDKLWFGRFCGYDDSPHQLDKSWCVAKAIDDEYLPSQRTPAQGDSGRMRIEWDGSSMSFWKDDTGEFELVASGVTFDDWDLTPENSLELLIGAYDAGHETALDDGSKVYGDNFHLVPEPASAMLLSTIAMAMLPRARRRT